MTTDDPTLYADLRAQGDGDTIGCRITVNGIVKDERSSSNVNGYIACLDKIGMSNNTVRSSTVQRSRMARLIRRLSVPILLLWIAIAAVSNTLAPQLEVVGAERSVGLNAPDAPSILAMRHIGQMFHEFDSDSAAMVVLEGDQPLGADAHQFYDGLVKKLQAGHRARRARPGLLG